ncbi:MAG: 4-hydroxyphenylacetate 3-hydroxylase family protein [Dehalococcoidia bacterium]
MVLDATKARGALTGARYIESLRDGREVWLNGERIRDVTEHPAFAGAVREFARIYDLQHSPEFRDEMTFVSPETGNRVSSSWLLPRTIEDLKKKRRNTEIWMQQSFGQMGRTPDFMSGVVVGYYNIREDLGKIDPRFKENVINFHRFAQECDLSLTHAIGDPQIDRRDVFNNPIRDQDLSLRVVKETADGVILRGAKQLATLAPISNEIMVYLSATFSRRPKDEFVQWFSIPMDTPGFKILCREPVSLPPNGHSYPLGSRFDEQDAMCFFDDVLLPWERIFLLYDREAATRLMGGGNLMGYSSSIRYYHRLMTFIGVTTMIAEAIGVDGFREVRDKLGEMIEYAELIRLGIDGQEADAAMTPGGLMTYGGSFGFGIFAAQISGRVSEILRQIGASGLLMQPSEADLANPELRPYIDKYMHGATCSAEEKSRLFRLGWELGISAFGLRQELYEYWHRGDVVRNRTNLYLRYDRTKIVERITKLIDQPMLSC